MRQRGDLPLLEREPGPSGSSRPKTLTPERDRPDGAGVSRRLASRAAASYQSAQAAIRSPRRLRKITTLLMIVLALLLISASVPGSPALPHNDAPAPTPIPTASPRPTATPWPTATATPLPPPPVSVPPGWQVYRGHHFAVAYPLGWAYVEHVAPGSDAQTSEVAVSFNSDDGSHSVGIAEREGLDAAALQQYCATPGTHTTLVYLPVITSISAGTLRMYTFVSAAGVAYTLLYPQDETSPDMLDLYNTMLTTFRPEVSASACG